MSTRTYDLNKVAISLMGLTIRGGFGENDAVRIERSEANWTMTVGADGEVTRARTNNKSGTVTITLMQTSVNNGVLQAAKAFDNLYGTGLFAMTIIDINNGDTVVCNDAWVEGEPPLAFGKSPAERQWRIQVAEIIYVPSAGVNTFLDFFGL